jgi:Mn-dependent DtxR family transcriptional regulator
LDAVFEIEAVRVRAVQLLRSNAGFVPTGAIAASLGIPTYAVQPAMDQAHQAGEVQYEAARGWRALTPETRHTTTEGEQLWGK